MLFDEKETCGKRGDQLLPTELLLQDPCARVVGALQEPMGELVGEHTAVHSRDGAWWQPRERLAATSKFLDGIPGHIDGGTRGVTLVGQDACQSVLALPVRPWETTENIRDRLIGSSSSTVDLTAFEPDDLYTCARVDPGGLEQDPVERDGF